MNNIVRLGVCIIVALLLLPALTKGVLGDGISVDPSISADGRYVAFESGATNPVTGDTHAGSDVFVRDRQTGTTPRVSKS